MVPTEPTTPAANDEDVADGGLPPGQRPTADEPGPRDVPDEKVIEKTLPTPPDREQRPG